MYVYVLIWQPTGARDHFTILQMIYADGLDLGLQGWHNFCCCCRGPWSPTPISAIAMVPGITLKQCLGVHVPYFHSQAIAKKTNNSTWIQS